jgi:hypothetical protein
MISVAPALRALLARSIDYAGMFPPCSLSLERALENQSTYVRDDDAWMLNAFVLPAEKFAAAEPLISQFTSASPLRLSALGPPTQSRHDFVGALRDIRDQIESFQRLYAGPVEVDQLEMVAPNGVDLAEAQSVLGYPNLTMFFEAPPAMAETMIANISSEKLGGIGYKLRTGGVTPDAFPTSAQIANTLVAAARHRVPIKFTAGLHHPVRQFRDEVTTKMHGFLNVLGAAVLAFEHGWDEEQTGMMLDDEDASSFSFADGTFAWREYKIEAERIEAHREYVKSFGSCSFDEPREDLRALHLF